MLRERHTSRRKVAEKIDAAAKQENEMPSRLIAVNQNILL
jgi:hypothetical protein